MDKRTSYAREGSGWTSEGISSLKGWSDSAGAAQGGGEVPNPGNVQGRTGRGTWCSGLGYKVGIGHRVGSMVLDIFSNLDDSVISP